VRWWAIALALVGLGLYLFDFQRITLRAPSVLGTAALIAGGRLMVGGAPQVTVGWFGIVASVVAVALFFLFAMTTIVRARFSTPTIGRTYLVGKQGMARTPIAPDGVVTVDGADWKASGHRESGIGAGDPVVVTGVDGVVLEVEPVRRNPA
jgi:membrane-bound ClpP family serine protease